MKRIALYLGLTMALLLALTGCESMDEETLGAIIDTTIDVLEALPTEAPNTNESLPEPGEESEIQSAASSAPESTPTELPDNTLTEPEEGFELEKNGSYTTKDDVALYLNTYGCLPGNYITKNEAEKLGWDSREGNLNEVAPGKSIGGDKFGNREGLLPKAEGRQYYECDIDYEGGYRNGKRIVYSNDGLIFYTDDHYESFETLYGMD